MGDESIEPILLELRDEIQQVLGNQLVGLYLYGSYVTGGSLADVSDLDLLAATDGDITEGDLGRLRVMHDDFTGRHPEWNDRIEVIYFSWQALASFKEQRGQIAVISPGEPLHFREEGAGTDWLMNWHLVRTGGRIIFGPDPRTLIAPTTHAEFIDSLRDHVRAGESWVAGAKTRKAAGYVTLTLCRTLFAIENDRHSSKPEAAEWAKRAYPAWTPLIDQALEARVDPRGDAPASDATLTELRAMFAFVQAAV
jgi:hypothetical protein